MNKNSTIVNNIMQIQSEAFKNTYQEVKTDWISQRIDNFNPDDKREFEQRYMSNLEFYNNSGLAFLKLGGENGITESKIGNTMNPLLILAKKYGAACFCLEHRFFGASQPFEDHSVKSYKYLTINQALADIKNFIVHMNEVFFSGIEKPRWILFGSSYSGALAAWFREMNEDLTIAAIVSSGVVQAEVDYYDHTKNLEYVLKEENAPCAETIRLSMKALIEKTYTADGRAELGKVFNMCEPFTEPPISKDIQFFLANVLSVFGGFIQYAGGCRLPDVSYFCDLIIHDTDGIGIIWNAWKIHDQVFQFEECFDPSYESYLEDLSDISFVDNEFASYRSWLWLSCTELGFFITTNNGKSIFGSSVSLDYFIDRCMDVFDVQYDAERVRDGVRNTLRTFGGYDNYKGSNTIFVTGSYDPWKSACCLNCTDVTRNVYSFIIEGGSHCIDSCSVDFFNLPALDDYRIFLDEKIEMFIAESSTTNDNYNSKNNNNNNKTIKTAQQ
ncbi:Uncharacterized protein BM_BM17476 [Brugia malayi]|uniref:Bm2392 n=1 Tax=Brugia malayi TaxID=6279 RepID=A0A4E9F9T1_BRUMA|nr:Uncharacterized protein BM_BM17476 [Brugia malayi]VIO93101.1 Uncharacterized protein BM_BM17476 [Brugia malayi]